MIDWLIYWLIRLTNFFPSQTEELHPNFRIWITSEVHPSFPITMLQVTIGDNRWQSVTIVVQFQRFFAKTQLVIQQFSFRLFSVQSNLPTTLRRECGQGWKELFILSGTTIRWLYHFDLWLFYYSFDGIFLNSRFSFQRRFVGLFDCFRMETAPLRHFILP